MRWAWLGLLGCGTKELPRSYAEVPSWHGYLGHIPADVRAVGDRAPREVWWTWQGHEVHLDVHEPVGSSRGTVVMVHGGGGHGRLLSPFALPLRDAGYRVVLPDLPGYGLTRVPRGRPPRIEGWTSLVADLACEEAMRDPRVALYGMSLGGMVALHAAMRCEAVRGVFATTLLDLQDLDTLRAVARSPASVGWLNRFGGVVAGLRVRVRALAPLDAMSTDPVINQRLADDPLIGRRRVPIGFFRSLTKTPPPAPWASFTRPLWVAHPAADAWTPPALSRAVFEAVGGATRWVELERASHFPMEEPGRSQLNEAARAFAATTLK